MEFFFTAFGQLDLYVDYQGDRCFVVIVIMGNVIEVDQAGLMGAEEILAIQVAFDLLQDLYDF